MLITIFAYKSVRYQRDNQRESEIIEQIMIYKTQKTKNCENLNPTKTGDELRYAGRVSNSCTIYCTRRVTLVAHPVIPLDFRIFFNHKVYQALIRIQLNSVFVFHGMICLTH